MGVIENGQWISDSEFQKRKAGREKDPGAGKGYVDPRVDSGGGLGALAKRLHDAKAAPSASPVPSPASTPPAPASAPPAVSENGGPDLSLQAFLARMAARG